SGRWVGDWRAHSASGEREYRRRRTSRTSTSDGSSGTLLAGAGAKMQHRVTACDWTIRSATPADVAAVLSLWRAAAIPAGASDTSEGLGALLGTDRQALLLAQSQSAVIGSLIAAWDGWGGSFYRLA